MTDFASDPLVVFDFGPSGSAVAEGAIGVTKESVYQAETGFGWQPEEGDEFEMLLGDSGLSEPALTQDFLETSGITFSVHVPDGFYRITTVIGDAKAGVVHTGVSLEGVLFLNASSAPGELL